MKITDIRAREIAEAIDAYDAEIAALNAGKKDTFAALREELTAAGLKGSDLSAEIAALKGAITYRRKQRENPEAVETREFLTEEYLSALTRVAHGAHAPARTWEASGTAAEGGCEGDTSTAEIAGRNHDGGFDEAQSASRLNETRRRHGPVDAAPDMGGSRDLNPGRHLPPVNQGGVTAWRDRQTTAPVRTVPAEKHDFPRAPIIPGSLAFRNLVEAYGWPEDEVQARWQSFAGGPSPLSAAVQAGG